MRKSLKVYITETKTRTNITHYDRHFSSDNGSRRFPKFRRGKKNEKVLPLFIVKELVGVLVRLYRVVLKRVRHLLLLVW